METYRLIDASGDFLVDADGDYLVWFIPAVVGATGRMSLAVAGPSITLTLSED